MYLGNIFSYYAKHSCHLYRNPAWRFRLQLVVNEIGHFGVEMHAGVAAINAVIEVRIIHRFELLVRIDKLLYQLHRILEMNIVVGSAVNQQK